MTQATYKVWTDCNIHGTVEGKVQDVYGNKALCWGCQDITATARVIKLTNSETTKEVCDSRCLNGSKSCGCSCEGSCHGMSNCNPELHPEV